MSRFRYVVFGILVVSLAGCGGRMSENDAEKGIRAMLEDDYEGAQDYVCEAEIENIRASTESSAFDNLQFDVKCQRFSNQMLCEVTFVDPAAREAAELEMRYEIKDGKLCERVK